LLAAYLEAEWSDFLWPDPGRGEPQRTTGRPEFYKKIPKLLFDSLGGEQPGRYCDIGGATGRTTYEMFHEFPSLTELVLAEPSAQFCLWAKRLLLGRVLEEGLYDWAPRVGDLHRPGFQRVESFPPVLQESGQKKIYVYEARAGEVPRPPGYFDIMTCLNVVDRVPDPADFAKAVGDLLRPGGTLVFASPMEYEEATTPRKELWVRDLKDLFPPDKWEVLNEVDRDYEARPYKRKRIIYATQVLILRKQGSGD